MFEQFTDGARSAVMQAQAEATARSDDRLGGEHLLLGLLGEGTGVAADLLAEAGVTTDGARRAVEELYGPPPAVTPADALAAIGIDLDRVDAKLTESFGPAATAPKPTPFDDAAKAALMAAVTAAEGRPIGTEHVLLGLLGETDGRATKLLEHLGVDAAALTERTRGRA
jgi:ATP-dependent Clp protease ATP-binding subunit ClpA